MLKRLQNKTEARVMEGDHTIRSEAMPFGIMCNQVVKMTCFSDTRRTFKGVLRFFVITAAALALTATSGCTTINISTLDGSPPRVERRLGMVVIRAPDNADDAVVFATSGFGAARTPTGFTLGFWKEQSAIFGNPSVCRTVIWVEDQRVLDAIRRSLSDADQSLNSLCIINGDTK